MAKRIQTRWTNEMIFEAARKCKTRSEFEKRFKGAYNAAGRRGIREEAYQYMTTVRHTWDESSIAKEALKSRTRGEFARKSRGAYLAAWRKGEEFLSRVCAHMPDNAGCDTDAPTRLYYYLHPEGYCYIGITSDWDTRHMIHTTHGHNEESTFIATQQEPLYWEGIVEHSGKSQPNIAQKKTMLRAERIAIKLAAKSGYKVVNKQHNPQYDFATGTYSWDTDAISA